jgi:4'-phosphopantetheinyl transferase
VGPQEVRLPGDEAHLWCAWLDAKPEQVQMCWQNLSSDERERAERFRFPVDREHFVVGRFVLRMLVSRYLRLPGSALRFRYGPFGKPTLDGGHGSSLRFNAAHSGGLAVYAFADRQEVGVDLEAEHSARSQAGVPDSCFTPAEQQALAALAPGQRQRATLALWTRKEAYLKALGCGLQQAPSSFEMSVPPAPPALLREPWGERDARSWFLSELQPAPGLVGTVCMESRVKVKAWSWQQE